MFSGLAQRVAAEVRETLRHDNEFASASTAVDRAQLVQAYFPRNMLAWVGGSIYAATESARVSAISSKEYRSSKGTSVPDWLTVADEEF
ncbi:Actin family [Phytophthora cactorum]|nr:Actin family [Phytophthora cactorum]